MLYFFFSSFSFESSAALFNMEVLISLFRLFTILFDSGANLSFILRDLKKNENILNYIYKRLHNRFDNIAEIDISKVSDVEYNLMKQEKIPSVVKIC